MNFLHPEILYALPLLALPVIIHLVQWKKYKKQSFTNVHFLKELEIKSRKSKKLKELLVLITRLMALLFLILAFAGPSISKQKTKKEKKIQPVIYLDNSLSMSIPKDHSNLFFELKMKLIEIINDQEEYNFFTNSDFFPKIKGDKLKEFIYNKAQLNYRPARHQINIKKGLSLFKKDSLTKPVFVYLSDNQDVYKEKIDSTFIPNSVDFFTYTARLSHIKNICLDSLVFKGKRDKKLQYRLWVSATDSSLKTKIRIRSRNQILWSKNIRFKDSLLQRIDINLPEIQQLKAKVEIEDHAYPFDNELYFVYNQPQKTKILFVGEKIPAFISKIYTKDEFELIHKKLNQIDYGNIDQYSLILLYGIPTNKLNLSAFKPYLDHYGNIVIIPDLSDDYSPGILKKELRSIGINMKRNPIIDTTKVFLNKIHFSTPFFQNVFLRPVKNFATPQIKKHIKIDPDADWLYLLSDQTALVQQYNQKGNVFLFSTDFSENNLVNEAYLIVPLFYQMGKWQQNNNKPYFTIGQSNQWSVHIKKVKPDEVVKLKNKETEIIPFQIQKKEKVRIETKENPGKAGIYTLIYDQDTLGYVAYNYNRIENSIKFIQWPKTKNHRSFEEIKNQLSIYSGEKEENSLWKYFIFLGLLMLITEMLIIKYWK